MIELLFVLFLGFEVVAGGLNLAEFASLPAEFVDAATLRQGMHACPIGSFITGVHIDRNLLLCDRFSTGYTEQQEFVDTSTVQFDMHTCPTGYAMTGVCVPFYF
jgi:hypothetical protein